MHKMRAANDPSFSVDWNFSSTHSSSHYKSQLKEKRSLHTYLQDELPLHSIKTYLLCQRSCAKIYANYFFVRKEIILVLLLNALFSTAIYGVSSEVLKIIIGAEYVLTRSLVMHGVTQVLFPVAGHLADTYVGRHNVIRFSLWTAWIGYAALGLSFSLENHLGDISGLNQYVMLPLCYLLLSISYVCFTATILPFGMDQMQGASHAHYRSFFHWWYWTMNVGVVIVNVPEYCKSRLGLSVLFQSGIGIGCITVALILDALFSHWFVIEPSWCLNSPLHQIAKVVRYVSTAPAPRQQRIPSLVRHELPLGLGSRMDLAKRRYGGRWEGEEVEDVRTFCRMLGLLLALGLPVFSYSGVFSTVSLMASQMNQTLVSLRLQTSFCDVRFAVNDVISSILVLTFVPVLDLLIVPLLGNFNPSIRKRMGTGAFLCCVSVLILLVMEAVGRPSNSQSICMFSDQEERLSINVYWILFPSLIMTIAQVLIYISVFEFICAQSPYHMRGLLIGIFFSIQGMFSLLSVVLQYIFSLKAVYSFPFIGKTGCSCTFWYYFAIMCVSVGGFILYVVVALKYTKRKRDDGIVNEISMIEDYFVPVA